MGFDAALLEDWAGRVLQAAGLSAEDAALAAFELVAADRRGQLTHGVARLSGYVANLLEGRANPAPRLGIEEKCGVLCIDGDLGLGQVVAIRAIEAAVERLRDRAIQVFLLRRVGHLGALGGYVRHGAAQGKVALISQAAQPCMAPEGSLSAAIGNNPLAFAAPVPGGLPLVVDLSFSKVARGNVLLAARTGQSIPDDWAIGPDGHPTTDPVKAAKGAMLPVGGHKGLGLAMIVQVLAGVLTGSLPQANALLGSAAEVGAFGLIADPAAIIGADAYAENMHAWIGRYRASVGTHGRLPGEGAAEKELAAARDGIPLSAAIRAELAGLGDRLGVPLPV
ncbi:MAG TPA: Ldh family oxidoreductase [Rhodospirillaceae bacterium]|nr:Ldh family oxidoreductase [Rhodospirillaceae bacterium]